MDSTFETIKVMRYAVDQDFDRFIVLISANFAATHNFFLLVQFVAGCICATSIKTFWTGAESHPLALEAGKTDRADHRDPVPVANSEPMTGKDCCRCLCPARTPRLFPLHELHNQPTEAACQILMLTASHLFSLLLHVRSPSPTQQ